MTYIHTGLPILTKTAQRSLNVAAHQIQSALKERGSHYDIRDINDVVAQWLESSIELLCEEANEMCVTGDRHNGAFNRSVFDALLKKVPSNEIWENEYNLIELRRDQEALALELVA